MLKSVESGQKVADVCREHGISQGTYSRWKSKYGGLDVSDARRLSELEGENDQLKHAVAELTLDKQILKEALARKRVTPAARHEALTWILDRFGGSWRQARAMASCAVSVARHRPTRDGQERLRARLRELAGKKPRYGYRRLTWLLRREGELVNPKRIYRLYRLEGLAVRKKKRKRLARAEPPRLQVIRAPNEHRNMDFMEDSGARRRKTRTLNVLDEYSRECLAIEVDTALSGARVCRVLDRLVLERGTPREIIVDHGPEYTSVTLGEWTANHGVELLFNSPAKPKDYPFIASFNGKFRDECLNENWFLGVNEARRVIKTWRREYNEERPRMTLWMRPLAEFLALWSFPAPGAPQTPLETTSRPRLP